jgi:rhombotail lipoprotein
VGIAFVPDGSYGGRGAGMAITQGSLGDAFSEPRQRELLERVAEAFRGTQDVAFVEVLPTHNLKGRGGFDELQPIAAMYGLNLVTLGSYDQVQFDDRDAASLLYWTLIGLYLVPGDRHETQTLLDASVFDLASRALLFSGSGSSVVKGRSTANDVRRELRDASAAGFEKATDDLIANLQISLGVFRANTKRGTVRGLGTPAVQVHRPAVQSAAASAGALGAAELAGAALLALERLLSATAVHGWPQLALFDLGAVLILGAWVEQRSRASAVQALLFASLLSGAAVLALRPDLGSYQGASAIACALFVLCAAQTLREGAAAERGIAALALAGFGLKLALEAGGVAASPVFGGVEGVESVAVAHAAGALAGALVLGRRAQRRRAAAPAPSTARIAPAISCCNGSS